jgi:hypothetical protein
MVVTTIITIRGGGHLLRVRSCWGYMPIISLTRVQKTTFTYNLTEKEEGPSHYWQLLSSASDTRMQ